MAPQLDLVSSQPGRFYLRLRMELSDWKGTRVPDQIRTSYSGRFSDIEALPFDLLFEDFRPERRYQVLLGEAVYEQVLQLFRHRDTTADPVVLSHLQVLCIRTRFLVRRGKFVHAWGVAV